MASLPSAQWFSEYFQKKEIFRLAPNFNGVDQYASINIPIIPGEAIEFDFIAPDSYPSRGAMIWDSSTSLFFRVDAGGGAAFGGASVQLDGANLAFGDPLPTDGQQHKIIITSAVSATQVTIAARSNLSEFAYFPIFNLKVNGGSVFNYAMNDGWSNNPVMLNTGSGANAVYVNATEDMWINIPLIAESQEQAQSELPVAFASTSVLEGVSPTYIVAGDSKRYNQATKMKEYYIQQFSKIGANVIYHAKSGMTGEQFKNNTDVDVNLNGLIASIPGDGSTSIVEYSFGANDVNSGATVGSLKSTVVDTLNLILAQKPNVTFLLISADGRLNDTKVITIKSAYLEVAELLGCDFVDGAVATNDIYDGDLAPELRLFYVDATHPSLYGNIRMVNYFLNEIAPSNKRHLITLEDPTFAGATMPDLSMIIDSANGYYNTSNGSLASSANWRRALPIAVEPNFEIRMKHLGNRLDIVCMDELGGFIVRDFASSRDELGYMHFTIPALTYELRINVSSDGAVYDTLNDQPIIEYKTAENTTVLTQAEINAGLTLNLG